MPVVDEGRNDTGMDDEVGGCVLPPPLALVEDYNYLHAPLLGIDECLGNRFAGEKIRLNKDLCLRGVQFPDDGIGCTIVRGEEDIDDAGGSELLGEDGGGDRAEYQGYE